MKILVAERDPIVAALIAESVRMQGHESLVAHDGQTASQLIESTSPDAVFLDLALPAPNGIEMLKLIRRSRRTLSVIVFSGPDSREMVAEAKRLGVTDVVEKPIVLARLGQALAQLKQR